MDDLNSIVIEGAVLRDPVILKNNGQKCAFVIATKNYLDESDPTKQEVSFFDVEACGELAEKCKREGKGKGVKIFGKLKQIRWEKDGELRSKVVIEAKNVQYRADVTEADLELLKYIKQ